MRTILKTPSGTYEIDRSDLGRAISGMPGKYKVILIPETDDEVRDQRAKAAKAKEERRSHAIHIHRPTKEKKEAFFYGRHRREGEPINPGAVDWRYEDILTEAGIRPIL